MNRLPLFKTGDLIDLLKNALKCYDEICYEGLIVNETDNGFERYDIEYNDVFENNEHYLDITILESILHYPCQPCDIENEVNNKFRINIKCV